MRHRAVVAMGAVAAIVATGAAAEDVGGVEVTPIEHATMVLDCGSAVVLVDPGDRGDYSWVRPDIVLVTHIHRDHFVAGTLPLQDHTQIVGPGPVAEELDPAQHPRLTVLPYGGTAEIAGVRIEAVPAHNEFHDHGWENGYVLTCGGRRVYISGDTGEVPPLAGIDVAFLSVRDPFSLSVEQAVYSAAVLRPGLVVPYHHHGEDVATFREELEAHGVPVRLLSWY